MDYKTAIDKGTSLLRKNSILNASLDAELLLSISLDKTREEILLNLENQICHEDVNNYINLIKRRKKNEPVSQISGKKFFWKYDFKVNKNVLTPRYETELMVEEILKIYKHTNNINILDIGTGSGCIIISLLKEKSKWKGSGIDISKLAIKMAKINAKIQHIENRIKFINSDIDKIYINKYDLIVSNPPYIDKIGYNNLDLSVKGYEPSEALLGGNSGTIVIEKVIKKSSFVLKNNGLLAMEIGQGQYFKVSKILKNNRFRISKVIKDYQKIKRCIIARKVN